MHTQEIYVDNNYIPKINSEEIFAYILIIITMHINLYNAFIQCSCKKFPCKCMHRIISFSFLPPLLIIASR